MRSAAQPRSRWRSQATRKSACPCSASSRVIADWSVLAEAAQSAKEFGRDVANKHFEEAGNLDLDGRLKSAVKNTKTIGNITGNIGFVDAGYHVVG